MKPGYTSVLATPWLETFSILGSWVLARRYRVALGNGKPATSRTACRATPTTPASHQSQENVCGQPSMMALARAQYPKRHRRQNRGNPSPSRSNITPSPDHKKTAPISHRHPFSLPSLSKDIHITHSTTLRASSLLLATTSATSVPHTSSGLLFPNNTSFRCRSASANSNGTQFVSDSGSSGSQRISAGRSGTGNGRRTERPRWMSSKSRPRSSSSSGSLLCSMQ